MCLTNFCSVTGGLVRRLSRVLGPAGRAWRRSNWRLPSITDLERVYLPESFSGGDSDVERGRFACKYGDGTKEALGCGFSLCRCCSGKRGGH